MRSANIQLTDPSLYTNRELSWLYFNDRVLAQATQKRHPLLERVRFVAISETNLDEFFMKRVPGLQQQRLAGHQNCGPDGMTPKEQLYEIQERTKAFVTEQRRILREELLSELEQTGIHLVSFEQLPVGKKRELRSRFEKEMLPLLTPLAVDPAHPFPHISNLSLNLLVVIRQGDNEVLARTKVPDTLNRFVEVSSSDESTPGRIEFVRVEEVVAANLDQLFPGEEVTAAYVFQVTRDADISIQEDEADDLLQVIEDELEERRFGRSTRLVAESGMPEELRVWLSNHLGVDADAIYEVEQPIRLGDLEELTDLDRSDLLYPPVEPHVPPELRGDNSVFSAIRESDELLYHPYDSFSPIIDLVRAAADDPSTLAIKQTLYRSGSDSPLIEALADARDNGTQVAALVELKARFDEEPNIGWARQLEERGVHVAYGIMGLKTHAKLCLVVRREGSNLRRYMDLGTGNFDPKTARLFTDFSYLSDDADLGADVSDLFNYLTGYSKQQEFRKLLVAPVTLRERILELMDRERQKAESGQRARIAAKVNQLTDPEVIETLYRASQSGVGIDLIVRGTCRLRPGIAGVSENIRVVSIVGRFLEHARVYVYGDGADEEFYLGSADLMERNLDRRVEQLFPLPEGKTERRCAVYWSSSSPTLPTPGSSSQMAPTSPLRPKKARSHWTVRPAYSQNLYLSEVASTTPSAAMRPPSTARTRESPRTLRARVIPVEGEMGTSSVRGVQDELSVQANMMHVRTAYTLGVNCGSPSHQIRELQPRTAELVVEPDTRVVQRQVHVVSVPTENLVFHVNTSISPHGWEIDEKVGDVLLATTIVSERKKPDEHRQAGWQESAQAPDLLVGYPQKIGRGRAGKPVKDGIRRISG